MTDTCTNCEGKGFYFDRRCAEEVCDHRGRVIVDTFKDKAKGEEVRNETRIPPMDCPARACPCPVGDELRRVHRARAADQAEAFALAEAEEKAR